MKYMVELRDEIEISDRRLYIKIFRNRRTISKYAGIESEINELLSH